MAELKVVQSDQTSDLMMVDKSAVPMDRKMAKSMVEELAG